MANFDKYYNTLLFHEGGYQSHPNDSGNYLNGKLIGTNWGITPSTYKKYFKKIPSVEDMKNLKKQDAKKISKDLYWDEVSADDILSQSIAELLFDFAYNSGPSTAIKRLQQVLKIRQDGIMGPGTLGVVNLLPAEQTFNALKQARKAFVQAIARKNKSQKSFIDGWMNRINSFKFKS